MAVSALRTALLAAIIAFAHGFTPSTMRPQLRRLEPRAPQVVMMPKFLKDLFPNLEKPDDALGGLASMFGGKKEQAKKDPTVEELEELCRDPESSGCDADMLEKLQKEKASSGSSAPKEKEPIWSKDIDDAVVKTE